MKTLVLLLLGAVVAHARVPGERSWAYKCEAYSESYCTGNSLIFNEAVPYLDAYNFDNTIACVRVTGVWLFYQHVEYNTYESGYVHWTYGLDYQDPMNDYIHDQASSLRYAGNQLVLNEAGYNLYHGTLFTGKDLYHTNDIPDLTAYHQDVNSIIIIGTSSWTFCEGTNYSGRCECLYAKLYDQNGVERLDVGFYEEIQTYPGLTQVLSVKQGC